LDGEHNHFVAARGRNANAQEVEELAVELAIDVVLLPTLAFTSLLLLGGHHARMLRDESLKRQVIAYNH
jgi:hypothetical protein